MSQRIVNELCTSCGTFQLGYSRYCTMCWVSDFPWGSDNSDMIVFTSAGFVFVVNVTETHEAKTRTQELDLIDVNYVVFYS